MADVESYTIPAMTTVTINLDLDEAAALRDLLRHVGGNPEESRRGFTDRVYEALLADETLQRVPVQYDLEGGTNYLQAPVNGFDL